MGDDGKIVLVADEDGQKQSQEPINKEKRKLTLRSIPFSLTCVLHKNYILTDPTAEEESIMETHVTVVLDTSGQLISLYKPGGSVLAYTSAIQLHVKEKKKNHSLLPCIFQSCSVFTGPYFAHWMEPLREKSKKVVCDIPKEGIKNTMNTESTVLDETNCDKQVSCSDELRKLSVSTINEEDRQKTLRVSLVGPSIVCLKKKLIVLDVNGLLVDIVSSPPKFRKADATVGRKAMFKRPFYLDFLNFCFEKFEVGVWSSRIKKNIDIVIDYLMGNLKERLLFCWDLSHCTETRFKTLENKYKPLVFKDLRKIWEKHDSNLPWEKGYFNQSNTLLLDDSPYKALLNPPHNSVFPHTFKFQNKSDNSLAPGGDLRQYLDGLANAENMLKYVEQHPFGQEGINERSQCWNFYLRVIDSLSTC